MLVVLLSDGPLAAVTPVANELDVVLTNAEFSKTVAKLVAVKPVTSMSKPLDEHVMFCNR